MNPQEILNVLNGIAGGSCLIIGGAFLKKVVHSRDTTALLFGIFISAVGVANLLALYLKS